MVYQSFQQVVQSVKNAAPQRIAVAGAHDIHSVKAAHDAAKDGLAHPVLVGEGAKVEAVLGQLGLGRDWCEIAESGSTPPGQKAVACIRDGIADFLMKGSIESKELLKPLVDKENGLGSGRRMCGFALCEIPNYPKLIVSADGGMIIAPDLNAKKDIIVNCVETLQAIGYKKPKVAMLCGVEVVNSKMQETLDAVELVRMNKSGEIADCVVVGPISYDLAISKKAAQEKGFDCPWCGEFDILVVPNLAAGNILTKSWAITAGGRWAGLIVGAKVPVVMTSRSSTAEEKYLSIALASLIAGRGGEQ